MKFENTSINPMGKILEGFPNEWSLFTASTYSKFKRGLKEGGITTETEKDVYSALLVLSHTGAIEVEWDTCGMPIRTKGNF